MNSKVVALVGMPGSGKSEVAGVFAESGFTRVRFGDITDEELQKRGLQQNEADERYVREILRQQYGMSAYAVLNRPRIDAALESSPVVIDGLYSWEEYVFLKNHYGERLLIVAVWSSPKTRYDRLSRRGKRQLTPAESASRDRAEIENVNKGGPIAMADFTILNETSLESLKKEVKRIISELSCSSP